MADFACYSDDIYLSVILFPDQLDNHQPLKEYLIPFCKSGIRLCV